MARPSGIALRRVKLQDIVAKLSQIEEQAFLTITEYPGGLTLERQRLILGLARQLRTHLRDQLDSGERQRIAVVPPAESRLEPVGPRSASNNG